MIYIIGGSDKNHYFWLQMEYKKLFFHILCSSYFSCFSEKWYSTIINISKENSKKSLKNYNINDISFKLSSLNRKDRKSTKFTLLIRVGLTSILGTATHSCLEQIFCYSYSRSGWDWALWNSKGWDIRTIRFVVIFGWGQAFHH